MEISKQTLAALLAAAGQPDRLAILAFLGERPDWAAVGEIQAGVRLPASTLSYHLERLRRAGWVTVRRQGPFLWHRLSVGSAAEVARLFDALGRAASPGSEPRRAGPAARAKTRRVRQAALRREQPAAGVDLKIEFD